MPSDLPFWPKLNQKFPVIHSAPAKVVVKMVMVKNRKNRASGESFK
jgi:hypothetical protein